jgi:iron complex outermembrane receptor protein
LPEALRLANNLIVAQGTSASWSISARGFNASVGNKLLVLIDGRSVYTPLFSGVIWNMQDVLLEDVERIEVISGPGGTLWGANAVNGVINITTRSSRDTQGLFSEIGAGEDAQDFVGARYGGALSEHSTFRVYGKYFDRDGEVFADGSSAQDSWDRAQAGFRMDAEWSDRDRLTVQGDFYTGNTDSPTGGDGEASGANVLGRWTRSVSDDADATLQVYYDWTHLEAPFPASGAIPAGTLDDELDTVDVDFQSRFRWGARQRFVWGLGYRLTRDRVENAPTVAFLPTRLDHDLYSAFIQDEVELNETLFLTLGTKLEHFEYTGTEVEPNVRLQWRVTDDHLLWAAVSRAVRTPARYDRDLFQPNPAFGVFLGGNTTFESEILIAYELGFRGQFGRTLSGSLAAFYNEYDKVRSLGFTPVTLLPLFFENNLRINTYGVELIADYQALDWWRLHVGCDFLREDVSIAPGTVDLFNGLNETADPEHQVFLRSSMNLPRGVELDLAVRWIDTVHNNSGPTPGTVPSYTELDMRLGWRATNSLELALVGQNLLHDHHPEAGFPDAAREEIARSVYGKVAWRF